MDLLGVEFTFGHCGTRLLYSLAKQPVRIASACPNRKEAFLRSDSGKGLSGFVRGTHGDVTPHARLETEDKATGQRVGIIGQAVVFVQHGEFLCRGSGLDICAKPRGRLERQQLSYYFSQSWPAFLG